MSWWFCESLVSLQWIQTNPTSDFSACLDDFDGFPQCKQTVFPSCEVVNMLLKSQLLITISLWLDCGWRNPHPSDHPLTCLEPPMWTYHEHVIRSGDILPIKISDGGTSRQPPSHPVLVQGFASAPARKQLSTCPVPCMMYLSWHLVKGIRIINSDKEIFNLPLPKRTGLDCSAPPAVWQSTTATKAFPGFVSGLQMN